MGFAVVLDSDSGETLDFWLRFGDDDKVVAVVAAVRGRSVDTLDMAAVDDEGNFPVSSSFLILDFKSSSSSQTVDGAVVDSVDSVPSSRAFSVSALARSAASDVEACRIVREPDKFETLELRNRASVIVDRKSAYVCGDSGDVSRLNRLRGTPIVDLALEPAP
jgi:hypothetical protein